MQSHSGECRRLQAEKKEKGSGRRSRGEGTEGRKIENDVDLLHFD
jgi:hypothetical protein